ncbi:MAG: hypothetical protein SCALA702_26150 [Melioribacteraceae bacterium]|nr:MAG: hypothetical protein SCALA702_26150 [Melioribacteraceae bacterium]
MLSILDEENPSISIEKLLGYIKVDDDTNNYAKLEIVDKIISKTETLGLDNLHTDALYHKGILLYRLNRYHEAKNLFLIAKSFYGRQRDKYGLRKVYEELGYCFERLGFQDSALVFFEKDLDISTSLQIDSTLSIAYTNLGHANWRTGRFTEALNNFEKAYQIRKSLNKPAKMASSLNSIGSVYWKRGNYGKALEYFLESTRLREELKDSMGLTISLNNIGTVFQRMSYFDKAEQYFNDALNKSINTAYNFGTAYSYYNLGLLNLESGNYQDALDYFFQSLEISEIVSDLNLIAMTNVYIGESYEKLEDYETARFYYLKSRDQAKNYDDGFSIAKANSNLARVLYKLNKSFNEIMLPLKRSYEISLEENLREIKKENYYLFYQLYNRENRIQEAFDYYKKYTEVKENILNENLVNNITNMIVKFELAKTETENELLKAEKALQASELENQKSIRNFIIIITILALILIVALSVLIKNKNKTAQQIAQQKGEVDKLNQELGKRNKDLKSSNETKDKLFSIISHDLRNPAGVLVNYCDYLNSELDQLDPRMLKNISSSIKKSSESILELVNNLLDWSRSQMGKIVVNPERVSIAAIFEHVKTIYENYANLKKLSLKIELKSDIHVLADLHMIDSVLRNLVSNALKFTPSGGTIRLTAEIDNRMCKISVIDNGIGMSEELQKSLLNSEYNTSNKGTDNEKGTGLGLLLSKEFIKLNGGKIELESKESEGSKFWFTLPLN